MKDDQFSQYLQQRKMHYEQMKANIEAEGRFKMAMLELQAKAIQDSIIASTEVSRLLWEQNYGPKMTKAM